MEDCSYDFYSSVFVFVAVSTALGLDANHLYSFPVCIEISHHVEFIAEHRVADVFELVTSCFSHPCLFNV